MIVDHFGLHRQDNLVFLHESKSGGRCLSPGLARMASPFIVSRPAYGPRCPHLLGEPEEGPIHKHPLVRAFAPGQERGFFYVDPIDVSWLWRLAEMCPGPERIVEPYWMVSAPVKRKLGIRLTLTNAVPLVLIEWSAKDFADIQDLASLPRYRNLIVSGPIKPPGAVPLTPKKLGWNHDWAAEGRRQLWHFIRKGTCR